jgi:hypothetical protein
MNSSAINAIAINGAPGGVAPLIVPRPTDPLQATSVGTGPDPLQATTSVGTGPDPLQATTSVGGPDPLRATTVLFRG